MVSCAQRTGKVAQHSGCDGELGHRQFATVGQRQDLTADMGNPVLVGCKPFTGRIRGERRR